MRDLLHGPLRYNQLRRNVVGITQKMLSQSLKEMQEDGLVYRTVFPEVPPRVEYGLTELGNSMWPIINAMDVWSADYLKNQNSTPEA